MTRPLLLALALALAITACGKRGPPVAPGPAAEEIFPRQRYPAY